MVLGKVKKCMIKQTLHSSFAFTELGSVSEICANLNEPRICRCNFCCTELNVRSIVLTFGII